ncbi:MAG: lysoplasmalogenase [Gemmatimonadaceae bacterium]
MNRRTILTILIAISGALRIRAAMVPSPLLASVAAPLNTILIIALAWTDPGEETDPYRRFVLAGLLFSLIGDVFLSMPGDRFLAGLGAFLLAHLSYIVAFTRDGGFTGSPVISLPLALFGSWMMTVLLPGVGSLALPVFAYMVVILTMAMQALERWRRRSHAGAALAGIGAILFLISDAALGVRRFAGGFAGDHVVVLVTYVLAQYLIASSAGLRAVARQLKRP